jgi:hypothetical protein
LNACVESLWNEEDIFTHFCFDTSGIQILTVTKAGTDIGSFLQTFTYVCTGGHNQGCQICLGMYNITKQGENIPNDDKITKCPKNISNGRKIVYMTRMFNNIFHSKVLPNIPKLGFLV